MIIKREFYFAPAGENRTAHIWLPEHWKESGERYPVMYFFDGHNLFSDTDATYGKSWGLTEFLTSWEKEIIIVGLECSHHGTDRLNEYCPYSFQDYFLGSIHGTGDETLQWIAQEVKPVIDADYPTWSHREATAIAGSSMGGLMGIYAAAAFNQVFSKAACLSSAIRPCYQDLFNDVNQARVSPDTRVYFSWGTEEAGGAKTDPAGDAYTPAALANQALAKLFREKGGETMVYCQRYGRHCEADWEKQVPLFMNFLWLG